MQKALSENDIVILIISLKDRDNVIGAKMAEIWKYHIIPKLPKNVKTFFLMESPIKHVFNILEQAESQAQTNKFKIYSDTSDIQTYNENSFQKYYPNLWNNGQIQFVPCKREEIANISGSEMRTHLNNRDFDNFLKGIPTEMDAESIYNILIND